MPDTPKSLADRLMAEGDRVVEFFKSLSAEQWGFIVYTQDEIWDMHRLLAHFVSAENGRRKLVVDAISGGKGAPSDFDIDSFNHREVERLSGISNDSLLELFEQERLHLIGLVSRMQPSDLERVVNDPFLGEVTLLEMIKLTYRHLQIHLRDARRCL